MTLKWKFNISVASTENCVLSSFFSVLIGECFLPCLFNWLSCGVFLRNYKFKYRACSGTLLLGMREYRYAQVLFGLVFLHAFTQLHRTRYYN